LPSPLLSQNIKITIYKTAILSVVLYEHENCSLIMEHRLREFENRMLRKILGFKRDEIIGGRRKLRYEELDKYCSSNTIRVIKSRRMR
jgi:hypothetical protein